MQLRKLFYTALLAISSLSSASAQDFPNRPLTMVVPVPPGGIIDSGARVVNKVLSAKLGQSVIIEYKPGAGGIVAAEYTLNAKRDGHMFLYVANGIVTNPFLFKKLSYDPQKDFIPLHGFQSAAMLLLVREDSPFKTFTDLIEFARKNPDKVNYSTVGPGSPQNLFAELLKRETGVNMTAVAYKGSSLALTDLLGGVIDFSLDFAVSTQSQIEAKKLRALAVTSETRLSNLPDVKTVAEQGYPGAVLTAWSAIVLPSGVPQPVIDKLAVAFEQSMDDPAVVKFFADQGAGSMQGRSKKKLKDFFDSERVKLKDVIERAGIKPE